jgi:hypothetical protein
MSDLQQCYLAWCTLSNVFVFVHFQQHVYCNAALASGAHQWADLAHRVEAQVLYRKHWASACRWNNEVG